MSRAGHCTTFSLVICYTGDDSFGILQDMSGKDDVEVDSTQNPRQ